ncbi:hypothetical protein EDB92DRAFT_1352451 [Lactarius akahatsu]|uniref:Uncharacterized protein n=1 Tax=Lactarius akahatsu TaxID=416441 RepID=A0AAD4LBZ8_9AGAM|nr:hypothetical protein EDB92DRAFT_1352451 [Lactarius akahatsu]
MVQVGPSDELMQSQFETIGDDPFLTFFISFHPPPATNSPLLTRSEPTTPTSLLSTSSLPTTSTVSTTSASTTSTSSTSTSVTSPLFTMSTLSTVTTTPTPSSPLLRSSPPTSPSPSVLRQPVEDPEPVPGPGAPVIFVATHCPETFSDRPQHQRYLQSAAPPPVLV